VYLTGFLFFVAGSVMCAAATKLFALVGARVMQGVGAAMLMAVGPAIVTRAVAPARRARGLGVQLAVTYVGLTVGPSVGGALASRVGWHAVFVVMAGAGAMAGAAAGILLEADAKGEEAKISELDLGGAVLFATGLSALFVALRRGPDEGWTSTAVLAIFAFAAVAFAVFVRHEGRSRTPLLPPALFRIPAFSSGVAGAIVLYVVTLMLSYLLPFELQREGGQTPAWTGAYMTAQPATMAIVAPLSGWIADRHGPRLPSVAGMIAIGVGLVGVSSTAGTPGVGLVAALSLVGVGAGLYVAPNSATIMGAAPRDRQGTAAAMLATSRIVGMTCGIAVAASLDHVVGFRRTVHVAAALSALGALLGAVRPALRSRPQ
jgi:MFS family permease